MKIRKLTIFMSVVNFKKNFSFQLTNYSSKFLECVFKTRMKLKLRINDEKSKYESFLIASCFH